MHGWSATQWWLLYGVNLLTFLAYYVLPIAWGAAQSRAAKMGNPFVPIFAVDFFLTRVFVLSCGTHHLVMLPLMSASHGWDQFYVTLLAIDGAMAAASSLAAFRAIGQENVGTDQGGSE